MVNGQGFWAGYSKSIQNGVLTCILPIGETLLFTDNLINLISPFQSEEKRGIIVFAAELLYKSRGIFVLFLPCTLLYRSIYGDLCKRPILEVYT